jgi:hypothetical protein
MDKTLAIDFCFNSLALKTYIKALADACKSFSEFINELNGNDDIKCIMLNYFNNVKFVFDIDQVYQNVIQYLDHYWNCYLLHVDWTYENLKKLNHA